MSSRLGREGTSRGTRQGLEKVETSLAPDGGGGVEGGLFGHREKGEENTIQFNPVSSQRIGKERRESALTYNKIALQQTETTEHVIISIND